MYLGWWNTGRFGRLGGWASGRPKRRLLAYKINFKLNNFNYDSIINKHIAGPSWSGAGAAVLLPAPSYHNIVADFQQCKYWLSQEPQPRDCGKLFNCCLFFHICNKLLPLLVRLPCICCVAVASVAIDSNVSTWPAKVSTRFGSVRFGSFRCCWFN